MQGRQDTRSAVSVTSAFQRSFVGAVRVKAQRASGSHRASLRRFRKAATRPRTARAFMTEATHADGGGASAKTTQTRSYTHILRVTTHNPAP